MDWTPPPAKYSTQEKASRFGNLLYPSLEERLQMEAMGAVESGNDPTAIGESIRNPNSSHKGREALGEYQMMPNTIAETSFNAKRKDVQGPEMEATDRFNIRKDLENNQALQDELALKHLRDVKDRSETEGGIPIGWIQGMYKNPDTGETLKDREQDPYYQLQLNRNTKYNNAKLEAIKKMFSK